MLALRNRLFSGRFCRTADVCRVYASGEAPSEVESRMQQEEVNQERAEMEAVLGILRPDRVVPHNSFRKAFAFLEAQMPTAQELKEDRYVRRVLKQRFVESHHANLGSDLAAAHFITNLGGKVRIQGDDEWKECQFVSPTLPTEYKYGAYVTEIDASGTELLYDGLENMFGLSKLRRLVLRKCSYIDDWCLDRICGEYSNSLQHLDISGCRGVSARGLHAIAHLRALRRLTVSDMSHIPQLAYSCLLLEDAVPGLRVDGVDALLQLSTEEQLVAAGPGTEQLQQELMVRPTLEPTV